MASVEGMPSRVRDAAATPGAVRAAELAGPAAEQVVRDAEHVEHLARDEVDELAATDAGAL